MPVTIGLVISVTPPLATLYELQTIYGSEDLLNMLEVIAVNAYNQRKAIEKK